jgi:hypothetical protein
MNMLYDIAVGGTSPRRPETKDIFTVEAWSLLKAHFYKELDSNNIKTVVGFGQAGIDHLVIEAYLDGKIQTLRLDVPGRFNLDTKQFDYIKDGRPIARKEHVWGTNKNHEVFSRTANIDSRDQLARCHEHRPGQSFSIYSHWDYFRRNDAGVSMARVFWAYTTSMKDMPEDGGTLYTWRRHQTSGLGYEVHFSIPVITASN